LFAIIVGVFILFLAIFGATRVVNLGQYQLDSSTAKKIDVLLNPLESGFESTRSSSMILPVNTRIFNTCSDSGTFGAQRISLSQESFGKWPDPGAQVPFRNKYIFSDSIVEGKKFFLFSKPFEFPFKVSDLIVLTSSEDEYCFVNAPESIKRELTDLGQENFKVENCAEGATRVCYSGGSDCQIDVNYNKGEGLVEKRGSGEITYFSSDSLMYAAIFSDEAIYECQVKRLMKRTEQLTELYGEKAKLVRQNNCNSNLDAELTSLKSFAGQFSGSGEASNSRELTQIKFIVEDLEEKNDLAICRLW
jgi:hypothetical protein